MASLRRILKVEKDEVSLVLSFFLLSLLLGVPQFLTITVSTARFLAVYRAADLPRIYIYSGLVIIAAGIVLLRLQKTRPPGRVYPGMLLLLCAGSFVLFFLNLFENPAVKPRLLLQLWVDVEFIFCNFIFWQSASEIFHLRAAKRLYGIIGAGSVCTALLLGMLLLLVLPLINPVYLLLLSSCSLTAAFFLLILIFSRFSRKGEGPEPPGAEREIVDDGLQRESRLYLFLILGLVLFEFFAHFYLDNVFYIHAEVFIPETRGLMLFLGIFGALAGLLKLLLRTFAAGRFLDRFGVKGGLFVPVAAVLLVFALFLTGRSAGIGTAVVFLLIAGARLFESVLMASLYAPAYYTLFQPFPAALRGKYLNLSDLVAAQAAAVAAGASLLLLNRWPGGQALIAPVTLGVLGGWALFSLWVNRRYRGTLAAQVSQRGLHRFAHEAARPEARVLLQRYQESPCPGEARLAAQLLALYHPEAGVSSPGDPPGECGDSADLVDREDDLWEDWLSRYEEPAVKACLEGSLEAMPQETARRLAGLIRKKKTSREAKSRALLMLAKKKSSSFLSALMELWEDLPLSLYQPLLNGLQNQKLFLGDEDKSRIERAFLEEGERITALHQALGLLDGQVSPLLWEAFTQEIRKSRERLFLLLSLFYDTDEIMGTYHTLMTGGREKRNFAVELLDTRLRGLHRSLMMPLLESRDPQRLLSLLQRLFPGAAGEPLLEEVSGGYLFHEESLDNPWIRVCLDQKGQDSASSPLVDLVTLLKQSPLFGDIPNEDLARLAEKVQLRREAPGVEIIRKDEYGSALYLVARGQVKVHIGNHFIAELGKGALFGELSALSPEKRTASITTLTETQLLYLDGGILYSFMSGYPDVAFSVMATIAGRIRRTLGERTRFLTLSAHPAEVYEFPGPPEGRDRLEKMILLSSLPLFQNISREDLYEFSGNCRPRPFEAGEVLFEKGGDGGSLFLLIQGEVLLEDPERFSYTFRSRSVLGELSVVDGESREAQARAVTSSLCLEVSSFRWKNFLRQQPTAVRQMMMLLIDKLRELMRDRDSDG